jgi:hypothetical protein
MLNAFVKESENQVGEKLNFVGLSPIEDFEEMIRQGGLEKVPGSKDLYRLKKTCD